MAMTVLFIIEVPVPIGEFLAFIHSFTEKLFIQHLPGILP